jgi:2-C-methyl-D-erythritol 2,4-cyclodiphosphate synthase
MLQRAADAVAQAGYRIGNLDCIVFAQRPKLGPVKAQIQDRIGAILDLEPEQIGVKAKTGERLGAVGNEEAIMAQCVALIVAVT